MTTIQSSRPAGWYADPGHRHEYRYWSGAQWTPLVSDNAVTANDPLQSPPPATTGQLPPATPPGDAAMTTPWPGPAGPTDLSGATSGSQPAAGGSSAHAQLVMAGGQTVPGVDTRISATVAEYAQRQYKVLAVNGSSVTMERAKTKFNWLLTILLTIVTGGVVALLYVAGWAMWGVHKTYRVTITLGSQGEVAEIGDVLAIFDRDRVEAHRRRCVGYGAVIALVAVLGLIGVVGSLVSGDAPDTLGTALGGGGFFLVLAGTALIPFHLARKAARQLRRASEWWRFGM